MLSRIVPPEKAFYKNSMTVDPFSRKFLGGQHECDLPWVPCHWGEGSQTSYSFVASNWSSEIKQVVSSCKRGKAPWEAGHTTSNSNARSRARAMAFQLTLVNHSRVSQIPNGPSGHIEKFSPRLQHFEHLKYMFFLQCAIGALTFSNRLTPAHHNLKLHISQKT